MSHGWKSYQLLFFFVLSSTFISQVEAGAFSRVSIAVLFNSAKRHPQGTKASPLAIRKAFERIPSDLPGFDNKVEFIYKDFNSTICDIGTFLSFMNVSIPYDIVILLLHDCLCERTLLTYLNVHNINFISSCEQPYFAVKGSAAVMHQLDKAARIYLFVPADKHGVEFHRDIILELKHMKLKLHRTLWLGAEFELENHLKRTLKTIADDLDKNTTSGVTFLLGFLYPNDFRVKRVFNMVRMVLGERFGKILWIFPAVHSDISNEFLFRKDFQALAFQEDKPETVSSDQNVVLWLLFKKTSQVLRNCYGDVASNETSIVKRNRRNVCFQEITRRNLSQAFTHSCFLDVMQLQASSSSFGQRIHGRRIATWNGVIIQACPYQEGSTNFTRILRPNQFRVFRVPIVEYFPYIVKHKWPDIDAKCPVNSLPCYGQLTKYDNSTVINYDELKYCCSGWTVDILIYLASKLPYEFELYFQAEKLYGVFDNKTGLWNGVIKDILSGKGDISVELGLRPDRCKILDCSLGYLYDGFNAIVKLEFPKHNDPKKVTFYELVGNFQVFINPIHVDLLVTIVMAFNLFLFLIWGADKICLSYRNMRRGRKKEKFTLLESTSYVWATAFGRDVGDSKKPLTLSARYLSSWLAFLALIFVNVYVARLMAEIVKQESTKPFTSLKDPEILDNNLRLGTLKSSSLEGYFRNTVDPVLKKSFQDNIQKNLLPSLEDGVKAVKKGVLDGFIADTISLLSILKHDPNCSLSLMGRDFSTNPVGFMFRKGWPWATEFKLQELTMNEDKRNGDMWRLKQSPPSCKATFQEHPRLGTGDMSGLFLVLIFATAYCCFSLFMENIYSLIVYRFQNMNDKWNVPQNSRSAYNTAASLRASTNVQLAK
ncbi:glutamate receptor ionotropic, NMDA 3A-like isoform X2 [Dendronephthya gigantea]|uniref:glutamate receptor ionotropic, NMDA 3A-like isoform X2 n=1 Tax=Dendronephthya gigantea TaxID=151771 RepID=UPI00106AB582|nr:glutamate receptor ionotropic, NMDA 3A-like isoform X2 [Dendronephthya gigantea]